MKIFTLILALSGFVMQVEAAGQYNSITIDNISIVAKADGNGVARITGIDGVRLSETNSDCSVIGGSTTAQFAFNIDTEVGKSWLSLAMAAQISGKKVHLLGNNQCLTWEDNHLYEELRNMYLLK